MEAINQQKEVANNNKNQTKMIQMRNLLKIQVKIF